MPLPNLPNCDVVTRYWDDRPSDKQILIVAPHMAAGDTYTNLAAALDFPWREELGARTLVIDTISEAGDKILKGAAASGQREKKTDRVQHGTGRYAVKTPVRGDYGDGQFLVSNLLDYAIKGHPDMDVAVIGHTKIEYEEIRERGKPPRLEAVRGGLATVGRAQLEDLGGRFSHYIRLVARNRAGATDSEGNPVPDEIWAQLRTGGVFQAGIRTDGDAPPKDLRVPYSYAEQVRWWADIAGMCSTFDLEDESTGFFRIGLYGAPKTGKTRLAFALPRYPLVYIAIDDDARFLYSVHRELKTLS